ncbi:glycosyltransferase family 1 protein [Kiritimatiellota bacterium B12222]|nr:glycosyltransferase family 1 protein [Kiritimatiellota bacterium B12222]
MSIHTKHLPKVMHNLRATKGWRVRDMVNWHRIVKPLRDMKTEETRLELYPLIFDLCTRFSVAYKPYTSSEPSYIPPRKPSRPGQPRIALFVDAPEHLSGVAVTISNWVNQAEKQGLDLTVHTAGKGNLPGAAEFKPMGTLELQNYAGMNLHIPCVVEVMKYMASTDFDMVHISTPGPMGMIGLMIARSLGLPVSGTYHTDFPRYSVKLSGDPEVEAGSWNFMRWFYGQMDRIACPSHATLEDLADHGFDRGKLAVVGRGVKSHLFHPQFRSETLRTQWGSERPQKLLYVGRISEEKNLDCLVYCFQRLCHERKDTQLIVVGDGPYLETMKSKLNGFPVVFTGKQTGKALHQIYASCDLFLFPSETDTFGLVVMEAQSSGLPVMVSAKGGCRFAMQENVTGEVISPMTGENLQTAVQKFLDHPQRMNHMKKQARLFAEAHTQEKAFDTFWQFHCSQLPSNQDFTHDSNDQ